MYQLLSIVEVACILSFVSMAAVFTFRFAGFPDLSVDGVFALGAVAFARLVLAGWNIPLALLGAVLIGMTIGFTTATISNRLHINPLLASVLVLTMLYSLNLRILGRANLPVFGVLDSPLATGTTRLALYIVAAACFWLLCLLFFKTELGTAIRSTGSARDYLTGIGRNPALYRLVLVALAGGSVAASGALLALKFGFADVSLGMGTIIIGIASLIIGERICGRDGLLPQLLSALFGISVYQLAVGVAYSLGISATDVKLGTGIIVIVMIAVSRDERHKLLD
ncbi:MAG TPA: hypothetical protein PKC67_03330 [Kiritimatiellia bacterium]|nr:hypothetical protein [Kiritimatiellia bacterium]HMP33359.1 hypothetical protein [Kiritimatiellia bacterium]